MWLWVKEVSASFFAKKEAKKLLFIAGCGDGVATARRIKSFLVLFFKKEPLASLTPAGDGFGLLVLRKLQMIGLRDFLRGGLRRGDGRDRGGQRQGGDEGENGFHGMISCLELRSALLR
jgi:hypothetical protein